MKKMPAVLAAVSLAGVLCAQNSVTVKQKKYNGWKARDFSFNRQAEIMNSRNFYQFNLLQYRPDKNGKTETFMNLSAPRQEWGFGRMPVNFLSVSVNSIRERVLHLNDSSFRTWTKSDSAGATVKLNFDGAAVIFDVFMKKDSPVLWFTFRPSEKQLTPIRSIRVTLSLVISRLFVKNGVTVWANAYNRQAQSAARKFEQRKESYLLGAEDQYLILSDSVLDGSGAGKGYGPSWLAFRMDDVQSAKLDLRNAWMNSVSFTLKPDFKIFRFGIWQRKNAISNQDFLALFEKEKDAFLLK